MGMYEIYSVGMKENIILFFYLLKRIVIRFMVTIRDFGFWYIILKS